MFSWGTFSVSTFRSFHLNRHFPQRSCFQSPVVSNLQYFGRTVELEGQEISATSVYSLLSHFPVLILVKLSPPLPSPHLLPQPFLRTSVLLFPEYCFQLKKETLYPLQPLFPSLCSPWQPLFYFLSLDLPVLDIFYK